MGSIIARGKSWYAVWREPDGRQRWKSFGQGERGRKLAKAHCEKVEYEILAGTYFPSPKMTPYKTFLREYQDKVVQYSCLESAQKTMRILKRFGQVNELGLINRVTTREVDAYIAARRQDKGIDAATVSNVTINQDLDIIKKMLRKAHHWGYLERLPEVPRLKEADRVKPYINEQEFEAIYAACPDDWWRGFLLFLFLTGWRFDQTLKLRWYNVDLEEGQILSDAYDTKGRRDVLLPLHPLLLEAIRTMREQKMNQYVFPLKGSMDGIRDRFYAIQEQAGIVPRNTKCGRWYGFHALRRGFATINAENLDPFELQKLMMHKHISTTNGYVEMAHRLRPAVKKIYTPNLEER